MFGILFFQMLPAVWELRRNSQWLIFLPPHWSGKEASLVDSEAQGALEPESPGPSRKMAETGDGACAKCSSSSLPRTPGWPEALRAHVQSPKEHWPAGWDGGQCGAQGPGPCPGMSRSDVGTEARKCGVLTVTATRRGQPANTHNQVTMQ